MEITIISEETVKVLDRYVFRGAGKWAVRALFLVIVGLAGGVIWDGMRAALSLSDWIDSGRAWTTVRGLWAGKALNVFLGLCAIIFLICTGAYVATSGLNAIAWLWRRPHRVSSQIILAWRETAPAKRILFALTLLVGGAVVLFAYIAMIFVTLNQLRQYL